MNKVGRALRPLKPTGKDTSGKRLVLGFDDRGSACGEQARWMNEQLEGSLGVRNLHDLRIEEWRRKALREEAPLVLTLFEVSGWRRCERGPVGGYSGLQ